MTEFTEPTTVAHGLSEPHVHPPPSDPGYVFVVVSNCRCSVPPLIRYETCIRWNDWPVVIEVEAVSGVSNVIDVDVAETNGMLLPCPMKAPRISASSLFSDPRASVWSVVSSCVWLLQWVTVVSITTRPAMMTSMIGIATASSTSVKPSS